MKAILYDIQTDAETASRVEAVRRGCQGTTQFWWPVRETKNKKYAVMIGDDFDVEDPETGEIITHPDVVVLSDTDFPSPEEYGIIDKTINAVKSLFRG